MATAKIPPKIVFKNKPENEMLIGAYVEPLVYGRYIKDHEVKVTIDQAYDDLKACNFNTLLQTESALNREDNQITYDMFEHLSRRGMNFLFRDKEIVGLKNIVTTKSHDELIEYFKKEYIPLAEKYSAFAGMHYIDEPGYKDWKRAKEIKDAFKEIFPDKLFFLNLLQVYAPSWALPNGPIYMPDQDWWLPNDPDYIKYFESYMKEADPELFSYDYYPMRYEFPNMLGQYFEQLHLSYKYAEQANIPLNCFIQNGTWDTATRVPNDDELRWQVNTALAYNTKSICYYTYWVPSPYNKRMCVHEYGYKTPNYYMVQQINKELLFQDEYILNAGFKGYIQVGKMPNDEVPSPEERLESFGSLKEISGGNLFIGCFDYVKKGKTYNMYVAVNNSITTPLKETLTFEKSTSFTIIHRDKLKVMGGNKVELDLTPGDAYIIIEGALADDEFLRFQ